MQAPTIEELDDRSRFAPLLELAHANLTAALRPHLVDRSPVIVAYWGANALALGLLAWLWMRADIPFRQGFPTVSLGPFIVLNALLAAAVFAVPPGPWQPAFGGALLFHVGATSGDIALANGLWRWRGRRVWTYDDAARGLSFFFAEETAAWPPTTTPSAPRK